MSRRKKASGGPDFFAFQDIVTSTTGILLIITLLMALSIGVARFETLQEAREARGLADIEATNQLQLYEAEVDRRERVKETVDETKQELAEKLAGEIAQMQAKLDAAQQGPHPEDVRVFALTKPATGPMRDPLVIVAAKDTLYLIGDNGAPTHTLRTRLVRGQYFASFTHTSLKALHDEVRSLYRSHRKTGVLFLLKPSATDGFPHIAHMIQRRQNTATFPATMDFIEEHWLVLP